MWFHTNTFPNTEHLFLLSLKEVRKLPFISAQTELRFK